MMTTSLALAAVMLLVDPVSRIPIRLAAEPVTFPRLSAWAGEYGSPPPGVGGLSGDELYLLSDGRYIYCRWADIQPLTVYDKGSWTVADNVLNLQSDDDVTWPPRIDRQILAIRRPEHPAEVLLVGTGFALQALETSDRTNLGNTLLAVALVRKSILAPDESSAIGRAVMKEAWRPERFTGR